MKIPKVKAEIWFELVHCYFNPGRVAAHFPVQDKHGYFGIEETAKALAKKLKMGKRLSPTQYNQFINGNNKGGYAIFRSLVVFPDGLDKKGYFVDFKRPALSRDKK